MNTSLPMDAGFFVNTDVADLGRRLRAGETSCVRLVQAALDSIARLNPRLNAFVHVDAEGALRNAAAADLALAHGRDAGPLHGIPVAVKDNIDTADMPTTYGSAHFAGHQPERDALCVTRLREAGAIIVGKTLTHEFAYGPTGDRSLQGAARNPWDSTAMTGGSSAGSACAVAAGMVPLAVGTDTGGSIRIPSAFCGAVGFKPSFGAVPVDGVFALASSLDHVGPIANNVADAALLFRVLSDTQALPDSSVEPLRVGWVPPEVFGPIDAAVRDAVWRQAVAHFGQAPAMVSEIEALVPRLQSSMTALQRAEAYEVHAERIRQAPELFDPEVRERLHLSAEVRGWEYIRAVRDQAQLVVDMAALFEHYDVLVMPTLPITAPQLDQRDVIVQGRAEPVRSAVLSLTSAWNVTGLPAISLPAGCVNGMPIGLQVIAARGRDGWLLSRV
ncbi:amidase [Pseudomonas abieticivorans]|uniref:amidase n=1 Tax=Pseudomonas abieticivorans TaxID=2931382 RepID=UPI0020C0CCD6|nr:amidase [Pseudomonas sp. PIA16]